MNQYQLNSSLLVKSPDLQFLPEGSDIRLFCYEYAITGNKIFAARKAKIITNRSRDAYIILDKLIKSPYIMQLVAAFREEVNRDYLIEKTRVVRELSDLAFSNLTDLIDDGGNLLPLVDLPADVTKIVSNIKYNEKTNSTEVKAYDKLKAIDMLARMAGLYEKDNDQKTVQVINPFLIEDKSK